MQDMMKDSIGFESETSIKHTYWAMRRQAHIQAIASNEFNLAIDEDESSWTHEEIERLRKEVVVLESLITNLYIKPNVELKSVKPEQKATELVKTEDGFLGYKLFD